MNMYHVSGCCGLGAGMNRKALPTRAPSAKHPVTRAKPRYPSTIKVFCNVPGCDGGENDFFSEINQVVATLREWGMIVRRESGRASSGPYTMWKVGSSDIASEILYDNGEHAGLWNGQINYSGINALFDPRAGYTGLGQIGRRTLMAQRRMGLGAITQGDMTLVLWTSNAVAEEAEARKMLDAFLLAIASEQVPVKASRVVQEGEYYVATVTFWMPTDKIEGSVPDTTPEPIPGTMVLATAEADAKVSGKTQWWKWALGIGGGLLVVGGAFVAGRKTR